VVNVTSASAADPLTAPSLRNLVLAPERYVEQRVTIQGQFRGRNLFGDQPQAPPGGDGRKEFVLRSADASLWVTGKLPKGRGFTFDIASRLDTRRWLEVSGVVKESRGLVWIVAEELVETSPQAEKAPERIVSSAPVMPPEVLFSAPTNDETDVPLDTKIRVQFSRDLNPDTLKGNVSIRYSSAQAIERGEPQAPSLDAKLNYNRGTRVLEIVFGEPLERFRTIKVILGEGISGTDGLPLKPYSLTFTLGGS
jgi:Bacterial Ig-like domain